MRYYWDDLSEVNLICIKCKVGKDKGMFFRFMISCCWLRSYIRYHTTWCHMCRWILLQSLRCSFWIHQHSCLLSDRANGGERPSLSPWATGECYIPGRVSKDFLIYLGCKNNPLCIGHNIKSFDCPILIYHLLKHVLYSRFESAVTGFMDSLMLFNP